MKVKILAFAGSTRTESYNKKFIKVATDGARAAGAEVTLIDLRDYALPLYDEDLEAKEGLPGNAKKLKRFFLSHDGLLISSPEYNSGMSGVLKNVIDWVSRVETKNEPPLACFTGKTAALLSASPGALGGLRGLVPLRSVLGNIGVLILPNQVALPKAHEMFDSDGKLKDAKYESSAKKLAADLVALISKLKSA